MADSEDEYDRKRRDKFRGERSSGDSYRSERRDDRRGGLGAPTGGRDEWADRLVFLYLVNTTKANHGAKHDFCFIEFSFKGESVSWGCE